MRATYARRVTQGERSVVTTLDRLNGSNLDLRQERREKFLEMGKRGLG